VDIQFVDVGAGDLFYRNLAYDEFDASEMSISELLIAKERGNGMKWDWAAIPNFMSKGFLWYNLYINNNAGIETLADLKGKHIGVPDYDMTGVHWMKNILKDLYDIDAKDIIWYNGRTKEFSHGGALGLHEDPPQGITLNWLTEDQYLDVMLDKGELDAAVILAGMTGQERAAGGDGRMFPVPLDRYGGTPLRGNPNIRHFFASDGGRAITLEYFKKTGLIGSNHTVIVQSRILNEHPWLALELYKALQTSKEMSYERARRAASAYMLFEGEDFRKQAETYGPTYADPYPQGIRANRKMLERLILGSVEQALIRKHVKIEDIWYRTTWDT
jgi:4,5-dihydroxyphthalate decarboxylase